MDHDTVFALKALTSPPRLRIAGRLTGEPATSAALATELGIGVTDVRRHLGLLVRAGLVLRTGDGTHATYAVRPEALAELGRALEGLESSAGSSGTRPGVGPDGETLPPEDARILRGFFDGGRLVAIPVQHTKRLVVLRYLRDRCFTEDRPYPEKEVNQRLALFHPDVAALRRSMVDEGLMTRADGLYRRPA